MLTLILRPEPAGAGCWRWRATATALGPAREAARGSLTRGDSSSASMARAAAEIFFKGKFARVLSE